MGGGGGKLRFLSWFGWIPFLTSAGSMPCRQESSTAHFHYQPGVRMRHVAFIILIFSPCLPLAHLFLYRLCTISQEQVARDGERSLLITLRGP